MILKTQINRPAIAMLELIFAIVIMGIILMSAPMLISTATKSGYVAIQQEAINEAASQVNMIMGYHWDENDADEMFLDPILHVLSGHSDLDENTETARRLGTPEESYRTFVRSDGKDFNASTLGQDANDSDDIDDVTDNIYLKEIEAAPLADNVETTTIQINTVVSYIPDSPNGGTYADNEITFDPNFDPLAGTTSFNTSTNIKRISVTLTSTSGLEELEKKIILHAFSCNIGGYKLEEKDVN